MKRIMKRAIALILVMSLFSALFVSAGDINSVTYKNTEDLGAVLKNYNSVKTANTVRNGKPIALSVTPGVPTLLNIVDLDSMSLTDTIEIPNCSSTAWMMQTYTDNDVYFGSYTKAHLFRYSPTDNKLYDLGAVMGEGAVISMTFDDGNIYMGTYPNCKIIKYNISKKSFSEVIRVSNVEQYVSALCYNKGYLYYQTLKNNEGLYRYNLSTGETTVISFPGETADVEKIMQRGKYLCMIATYKGARKLMFYDTKYGGWQTVGTNVIGKYVTPILDNAIYYVDNGYVYKLDLSSFVSTKHGNMGYISGVQGEGFAEISDPEMPGANYVNITYSGQYQLWNIQNKILKVYPRVIEGANSETRSYDFGPDGRLYVGEYMGTKAAAFNVNTRQVEYFHMAQPESMCSLGDKMYFGNYTKATFYILDTTKRYYERYDRNDSQCNPRIWGELGESQDRPFKTIAAGDKIVQASFPDYGELGGALSIYDPATDRMEVKRNIVPNQSPISLAYKDGKVWFGTSVSGGLGIYPSEEDAMIGFYDLNTKEVTYKKFVLYEGISEKIKGIEGLSFAPDGKLLGYGRGYIFKMDPETLNVTDYKITGQINYGNGMQIYWPYNLLYDNIKDIFYICLDGKLTALNYKTLEYKKSDTDTSTRMVMGPNNNIYYINSLHHIIRINPERNDFYVSYYGGGSPTDINIISYLNNSTERFKGYGCTFSLGVPEPIKGLKYVQTNYSDGWDEANKSNERTPWISITFDKSATVYYLTSSTYISGTCQEYLYGFNGDWIRDTDGNPKLWKVNNEANWIRSDVYIYKFNIDVTDKESETLNIKNMGSNSSNAIWSLAIDTGEEPEGELTLFPNVFTSNAYYDNILGKYEYNPSALLFANIKEEIGKWDIKEYGILNSYLNIPKSEFTVDNPLVTKYIGNASATVRDKFGILLKGTSENKGMTYFALPYEIYVNRDTKQEKIIYGSRIIEYQFDI